eukprot:SAG11_NODE_22376_length_407_cov_0.775974_1_plen_121_part_10
MEFSSLLLLQLRLLLLTLPPLPLLTLPPPPPPPLGACFNLPLPAYLPLSHLSAVYSPAPKSGETQGYSRMEISMGWRLPPLGETNHSTKEFLPLILSENGNVANSSGGNTQYKSTNTDVLG